MAKFHIHPVTGTPAGCVAADGNCPYDGPEDHYATKDEARAAYEARMEASDFLKSVNKDTQVEDSIIGLIDHQIAKTRDPDTLLFLKQARLDITSDNSLYNFSRLASLYSDVEGDDSIDDPGVLKAALVLKQAVRLARSIRKAEALVAETRKRLQNKTPESPYYRGIKDQLDFHEEQLEEELARKGKQLDQLANMELNLAVLEEPKPGDTLKTTGHRVDIVDAGDEQKPAGKIYVGRAQSALDSKNLQALNEATEHFVRSFERDGEFVTPDAGSAYVGEGFKFLACGAESNAYLHEESGMVFKIPHESNEHELARANNSDEAKPQAFVAHLASAYARIDRKALAEKFNAEYAETYFLSAQDSKGRDVGVIVQPYLSEELYADYDPEDERRSYDLNDIGVSDVYAQNVRVNKKTKKLVLFDCLFDL